LICFGDGRIRLSPVEDRRKDAVAGGGGGGARFCAAEVPGIGGTRLARLLFRPGVVGDVGIGGCSVEKYDALFAGGERGEPRGSKGLGVARGASAIGVARDAPGVGIDISSSDWDPALGDIGREGGGIIGRAIQD